MRLGIVVIGRNEGKRLAECLDSVAGRGVPVAYVDSGSSDGSTAVAAARGVEVVELTREKPFTAARARNAGFEHLLARDPGLRFVQFVDGDCVIDEGWLTSGRDTLEAREAVAVVFGRIRELRADASIYNRLCDLEWRRSNAKDCGFGICMVRVSAFREAGGFDPTLAAGEEPDLLLRMRRRGWKVLRIDAPMCEHDAQLTRFSQWWQRTVRGGRAYAEAVARYGRAAERRGVRESISIWLWAMGLPLIVAALWIPTGGLSVILLVGYPVLIARICVRCKREGNRWGDALLYATFCVLGKWPQAVGQIEFWTGRHHRRMVEAVTDSVERVR